MSKLNGKIAVITGGSSGIGLAAAKKFVEEGAHVFIMGRRESELDRAKAEIGRNVTTVQGDVAELGDLDRLYQTVKDQKGALDTRKQIGRRWAATHVALHPLGIRGFGRVGMSRGCAYLAASIRQALANGCADQAGSPNDQETRCRACHFLQSPPWARRVNPPRRRFTVGIQCTIIYFKY